MLTNEDIYRQALEQLAAQGNDVARSALGLGSINLEKQKSFNKEAIATCIKNANEFLVEAIYQNGKCWNKTTDDRIQKAINQVQQITLHLV